MATNDFLPFANGGGANVLTQAQYAALTTLLSGGYQSGVANSAQMNKTWRQSSIMAAVLGQFIANQTGQNAVDDGTTATLLTNLIAAVSATSPVVVGSVRNLAMSVTAASATATLTADEIIVESALGGLTYKLANFSKTINLATTGAGGMDTGTAPVGGYVALYAIYNPTTQTSAILATSTTSAVAPSIYAGANMPSGYAASALVSVWPTNASSQFAVAYQTDRSIYLPRSQALNVSTASAASTVLSISGIVPKNAREVMGDISASTTGTTLNMAVGSAGAGAVNSPGMVFPTFYQVGQIPFKVPLISVQAMYYYFSQISGTFSGQVNISGYTI